MRINPRLKDDLRKYLIDKMRSEKNAVKVISSYNLGNEEKQLLKKTFPHYNWQTAKFIIDPSIIAGIIITVGSQVIDLSIKVSLSNLQNIVYESN